MRFNNPTHSNPKTNQVNSHGSGRRLLFAGIFLFVLAMLVGLYWYQNTEKTSNTGDSSAYYAIFLDNSQVYFGKITSKTKEEVFLKDVYYLQANNETVAASDDSRFSLIKLGQELHGPTNEMIINMEHVVFYERLREDSQVVQSIRDL